MRSDICIPLLLWIIVMSLIACQKDEFDLEGGPMFEETETAEPLFQGMLTNGKRTVKIFKLFDFAELGISPYQSAPFDDSHNRVLQMRGDDTGYLVSMAGEVLDTLLLPNLGHQNDATIRNGIIYTIDGAALSGDNYQNVYKWEIGAQQGEVFSPYIGELDNYSKRVIGGICEYNSKLFFVAYDYRGSNNQKGDKYYVYSSDTNFKYTSKLFEDNWEGWFVQGCTIINGYLYVAANMLPDGELYAGINIFKIDLKNRRILDKLQLIGDFEPQGLDSKWEQGLPRLYMGISSWRPSYRALFVKLLAF